MILLIELDNIDLDDSVTFVSDGMGLNTIDSDNINLDDDNFDADDLTNIGLIA